MVSENERLLDGIEEWQDQVFLNASEFRVQRFSGNKVHEGTECKSFPEALAVCGNEKRAGYRVLIYVITGSGRHFALEEKRLPHYIQLFAEAWEKKRQDVRDDYYEEAKADAQRLGPDAE